MYKFVFIAFNCQIDIFTNDKNISIFLNKYFFHCKTFEVVNYYFKLYITKDEKNYVSYDGYKEVVVSHENIFNHIITRINDICIQVSKDAVFFHAASFMIEKKLYIIPSSSGSGKTTFLSLVLNEKSLDVYYISDDIVMFDNKKNQILGLPCGLKIKEGTLDKYFYGLKNEMYTYPSEGKKISLFTPDNKIIRKFNIKNFEDIIFVTIKYDSEIDFTIEQIRGIKCVEMLINNLYGIDSNTSNCLKNISTFNKASFYKMQYSNNDKAIEQLLNI